MFKKIFDYAKSKGIEDLELYIDKKEQLEISLFQKEIDTYTISEVKTIAARGVYNGKMGYASSEQAEEGIEKFLVETIIKNAEIITSTDISPIYEGDKEYKNLDYSDKLTNVEIQDKINLLYKIHEETLKHDEEIVEVAHNSYEEVNHEVKIINSKGLNLERKQRYAYIYLAAVAERDGIKKDGASVIFTRDFKKFDVNKMVVEASNRALSRLGATSIPSKEYKILLENKVATSLVGAVLSNVYADNVQKGYSALKNKLNEKIASSKFTLVEDPFNEEYLGVAAFDDEGVATTYKKIIDKGVLTTYLYNLKTALKDNVKSTGNGFKMGPTSLVSTSTTNLYVEKGDLNFFEMVEKVKEGLFITSLAGLHSGLDPISGNFSLQAEGFLIEKGKLSRPVNLITVAGNLYELLLDIEEVGSDLGMGFNPTLLSPSLIIKKLAVSGE